MRSALLAAAAVVACACAGSVGGRAPSSGAMTGLDALAADGYKELRGRRVALMTDETAVDRRGRRAADLLKGAEGVKVEKILPPRAQGGADRIEDARIDPDSLRGLDAVVFDVQDTGTRFDPRLAHMAMALEAAKTAGVDFIVLDRPNPIRGDVVEGPILADANLRFLTPTAYFQVPARHGLTAGEMALLHNKTVRHPHLKIVPVRGWRRDQWHDQTGLTWVPPVPSLPDVEAASLFPGIGIFEASNLSVGRGTPMPFRWIGAPWMDGEEIAKRLNGIVEGVEFSAQDYMPTKSVFEKQLCHGVKITVTDRDAMRPLTVFRKLALALRELHSKEFEWRWDEAKRMVGNEEFRLLWETGADEAAFIGLFDKGPRDFEPARKAVLLY